MKRLVRIPVVGVVALLLMLVLALTVQAQGGVAPRNPQRLPQPVSLSGTDVTSVTFSEAEQADALRYWTPAAKASAEALTMIAPLEAPDLSSADASGTAGAPGFSGAGVAAPDANAISKLAYPLDWAVAGDEMAEVIDPLGIDGTSGVYDWYNGNKPSALWKIYPHIWEGLLTFNNGGGKRCSATAISNSRIVTAAHCIFNTSTNVWSTSIVFSPAYRNGSAPYGTFAAQQCWVLTAWVNLSGSYSINSWAKHDVAVCRMGNNSTGRTLAQQVGWAGRQWNYSYIRHFFNMGYPAVNYNNQTFTDAGKYLFICAAESRQQATDVLGMGCYMGGGASGGGWLAGYKPTLVAGAVNSVNSGIFIGQQNIYGARFTSNNIVPLCNAAGC